MMFNLERERGRRGRLEGWGVDGGRDGSVEYAETTLFSIKGSGSPLLFIYSPKMITDSTGWKTPVERKGWGKEERRTEGRREEGQGW